LPARAARSNAGRGTGAPVPTCEEPATDTTHRDPSYRDQRSSRACRAAAGPTERRGTPAGKHAPAGLLERPIGAMASAFRVGDARLRDCSLLVDRLLAFAASGRLDAPRSWTL